MNNNFDTVYREGVIAYDAAAIVGEAWLKAPNGSELEATLDSVRGYLYDRGDIEMEFCRIASMATEIPF